MSSRIVDCPVSYGSLLECNISYPYIHVNLMLLNHKGSLLPQTHDTRFGPPGLVAKKTHPGGIEATNLGGSSGRREICVVCLFPQIALAIGGLCWYNLFVFTMWHLKRCALSVNLIWLVWIKTMFLVGWQGILFGHLVYLNITVSLKHHVFVEKSTSQPIFMLPLHKFWCSLYQSACWATRFVCCQEFVNTTARIPKLFQWWNGCIDHHPWLEHQPPKLGPNNDPKHGFLKWFVPTFKEDKYG